ncbi:MAG TPA: MFS transporter [Micropepsaceae bacterium]|nr:MFS transporter [Micropepsaceae bacterium]
MVRSVDVAEVIDSQNVSLYQCVIALMAWITLFLDGVNTQSLAYVAPAIGRSWHLGRGALGPVFSASIVGVAFGAIFVGPLADRFGRKRVIVSTVAYVALLTLPVTQVPLIASAVPGATLLGVLMTNRFLAGLGLGALVPLGIVIGNEFAPSRRRGAMVTLMGCGYAVGSALGGILASGLIPLFGWESQFYAATAVTLVMAGVLAIWLPESIRYLTIRRRTGSIIAILRRINPQLQFAPDTEFRIAMEGQQDARRLRPGRLFTEGRAVMTFLLWLSFFMNLLALNYLNNWLPTLTTEAGLPGGEALRAAASLQFGGMLGIITMGFLADRFGFDRVLAATFIAGGLCISLIGLAGAGFYSLAAAIFAAGFFVIGSQITLGAFAATLYPTSIRSTGVSWAHGFARCFSIVSVLFAGAMLAQHWPLRTMYLLVSIPMFFGCLWILLLASSRSRAGRAQKSGLAAVGTGATS